MSEPIATAPKDRRILGYGVLGFEDKPGWGTVRWNPGFNAWQCDPNEATEYSPETCDLTHWAPLPPTP